MISGTCCYFHDYLLRGNQRNDTLMAVQEKEKYLKTSPKLPDWTDEAKKFMRKD
jgi:hypothetical protein